MPITIKSVTSATSTAASITIPATVSVGDLLVLMVGQYNSQSSALSGWTAVLTNSAASTYAEYVNIQYRIAQAGDAGSVVSIQNSQSSFSGISMLVITGHNPAAPIPNYSIGNSTGGFSIPGYTTTVTGRRFVFLGQMANTATVPDFTVPSGTTLQTTVPSANGYHRTSLYSFPADEGPAALAGTSSSSTLAGASAGQMFTIATFPNAVPTASSLVPDNTFKDNRTAAARFSWTYADAESNAQYRYEIGYRLKESTGAWTETTQVSSNAYHDFATNTFTNGSQYDWRLRVDDNVGGWSPYYTATFTAGTSHWITSAETLSSGADIGTNVLSAHGNFEAADSMALGVWESNNAFGSLISSTVARTTTKPDTGSYSLEVTLPTLASNQATIANCSAPGILIYGKLYRLTARVWMQVGGPDFRADMLYQGNLDAPVSNVKGAWTTVTCVFINTSSNGNQFPAIRTVGAATAGQKMYVDNVILHEVGSTLSTTITPAEAGEYYVQVRTADEDGFGPWSANHNAVVNPLSNKFVRVGGVWVVATNHVKVGGIWQQAQPTKIRTGGSFPA